MLAKLLVVALLGTPSISLAQTPPASKTDDIVVTGRRLSDTERALADCLARRCPVDEDVNASLAHAENLFVAGEYAQARRTTKASLHRNRAQAARYPVPVADLERSNGRISAHLGEKFDYQYSTWGIRRALKAGLPATDPRLVGAEIEIAQMLVATDRLPLARQTFNSAIRNATRIDRPDLAAAARLRLAYLEFVLGDEPTGRRSLEELAASVEPRTRGSRIAALLLLSREDRKKGRPDRTEMLLAELREAKLKQPVLIFSPNVELIARDTARGGVSELPTSSLEPIGEVRSTLRAIATDTYEDKWIDVGFWVRPGGRVEDIDVLRASGNTRWAAPVLKSIAGRQYSPVENNGAEGAYRVERFSYTSFWRERTGTRIRERGAGARIESLDLTSGEKVASN